jgi:hypothetical protein
MTPGMPGRQNACRMDASRSARHGVDWDDVHWHLAIAAFSALPCLPFIRNMPGLGDEGVLLHGAQRILLGEVLYRDFFAILPPFGFAVTTFWMALFGGSLLAMRVLAVIVIVLIALLTFQACRLVARKSGLSALLTLAWVTASQGYWTVVCHHWFTSACIMGAYVTLLGMLQYRVSPMGGALASGVLIGAAGMTTSARGAAAAIIAAVILLTSSGVPRRALGAFVAGMAVVPGLLSVWLAWQGALDDGVAQFVFFAGENYSSIQWVPFGNAATKQNLLLVLLFPSAFLLAATVMLLERGRPLRNATFRAALLFAGMGWLTIYPRPDVTHIGFTAPLALPLLAVSLDRIRQRISSPHRWIVPAAVAVAMVPGTVMVIRIGHHVQTQSVVETDRGRMLMAKHSGQDLHDLLQAMEPIPRDDGFFFYPYDAMLPYLTERRHAARLDIFLPEYTTAGQYLESCAAVLARARWVVIEKAWFDPKFLKGVFPGITDPSPAAKQVLESAIDRAFSVAMSNSHYALLRQKDEVEGAAGYCRVAGKSEIRNVGVR